MDHRRFGAPLIAPAPQILVEKYNNEISTVHSRPLTMFPVFHFASDNDFKDREII